MLMWLMLNCLIPETAYSQAGPGFEPSIDQVIAQARQASTLPCNSNAKKLQEILCSGQLRVGIRNDYPSFGTMPDGQPTGYEPDIARFLAERLGVGLQFIVVTPATRIAAIGENRVDLVIATMGHTTQRDGQARFIQPHYYASQTLIVGPKALAVSGWPSLSGATVCVPIGAFSNTVLIGHGVRLLLFNKPEQLLDALRQSACQFIAHDDSFFANLLAQPEFAAQYDRKLSFATLPWGMAVGQGTNTLELGRILSELSQVALRDGTFLRLAEKNGVATEFLHEQQAVWNRLDCNRAAGAEDAGCVLPPTESSLKRLEIAEDVERFQTWIQDQLGLHIQLPMLQTVVALNLFLDGLLYTIVLVLGAMICTLLVAVGLAVLLRSQHPTLRRLTAGLMVIMQSSPIVLLLFVGYTVATALTQYSLTVAIIASVIVLGLFNGSHAGRAIAETYAELLREREGLPPSSLLLASRASGQVTSFLINASKGSAAASMIGTPELLGAMTDISSFSSERITLYSLLLLLYLGLVLVIITLCGMVRRYLVRLEHQT